MIGALQRLRAESAAMESNFRRDYAAYAKKVGVSPDPDDPLHFYDYRAAWRAGELTPDASGHLSSAYKREGHPRMYVGPGGKGSSKPIKGYLNTKTGRRVE